MIAGTLDVLFVCGTEFEDAEQLRAAGLEIERTESVVGALARLRAGPAALVVAHGDTFSGREREAFEALREAGAAALLAVYPPLLSWRVARALHAGADDSIALPADPGALAARVLRLVRAAPAATPLSASDGSTALRGERTVEALVGDLAVIHRNVTDLDRLLEQVLQVFVQRTAANRCSLMLLDEARGELHVKKSVGLPDAAVRAGVPLGKGLSGHVAKNGMPLLVADVERLRGGSPQPGSYKTRSCLLLPMRTSHGVIGVVCLADKETGLAFDQSDLGGLALLADQAAQAIENALQFRHMQELAAIDELTGLANRRQFQFALDREIQRARRYDRQLTLALFDVDFFKKYNDTCGHPAGDRALAAIGEILRSSLREVDIVARYGGEEFAVILPETAARPGAGVSPFPFLERLRRRVESAAFPGEDKIPNGKLTISGGIASFPDDAATVEDLIREADRALYVSKARGRNTITYRGGRVTE